jgi:hypothetical protein
MEDQIQKHTPFRLIIIQAKTWSLFQAVKYPDPNAKFLAGHGWSNKFKARADTKAAEIYPEV